MGEKLNDNGGKIMAFTQEEEEILRLIINELRTRKQLDVEREARDTEFREALRPLRVQIDDTHKVAFDALQKEFNDAENAIIERFK